MVRIPTPQGSFCIDTTEVSQAHYGAFVAAKGKDLSGQPEMCAFNTDWAPTKPDPVHGGGCQPVGWDQETQTGSASLPMGCTDWCDARAYCEWAGKRLCGKVGGGVQSQEDKKTVTLSEQGFACSQGGKQEYPYGAQYQEKVCAVEAGKTEKVAVGKSGCHGGSEPYSEVYDLVGNVDEWEDGPLFLPDGDSGDKRWAFPNRASAASLGNASPALGCSGTSYYGGVSVLGGIGIRCCAD